MKRAVLVMIVVVLAFVTGGVRADVVDVLSGLSPKSCSTPPPDLSAPNSSAIGAGQVAFPRCEDPTVATEAKSGCCSHHGGVCGCDSNAGRQICCDGKLSPSCGC